MADSIEIKLFEDREIRSYWDETKEEWFFCVADVVSALTDSADVRQYVKKMRQRDPELNSVWGTICTPHQFVSTDITNTEHPTTMHEHAQVAARGGLPVLQA